MIWNARDPKLFGLAKKRETIFAAGRVWDDAKNLAALEAVAPRVRWPIEIAGNASHPNGSAEEFKNIRSLGRLSSAQLSNGLSFSAIYALPARYEPFGLSAVEAALSGCALVLGDVPSLREVWGDAAVFVAPEDHGALTDALNHLIEDDGVRNDFAERALARAEEFSPAKMAGAYRAVYRACLARRQNEVAA